MFTCGTTSLQVCRGTSYIVVNLFCLLPINFYRCSVVNDRVVFYGTGFLRRSTFARSFACLTRVNLVF